MAAATMFVYYSVRWGLGDHSSGVLYGAVGALAYGAVSLLVGWLLHHRRLGLAAVIHLVAMTVGLAFFFSYKQPTATSLSILVAFFEAPIVAALVLRPTAAFAFAGLSAASFAALTALHGGPLMLSLQMTLGLLVVGAIAWLAASYLEMAAAALLTKSADLAAGRDAYEQISAALQLAERQSRALFSDLPVAIMLFDRELIITDCNERFADLLQTEVDDLVGASAVWFSEPHLDAALKDALEGTVGAFEGELPGGGTELPRWINFTASPLLGAHREVIGGIGVVNDLTDQRQGRELLEQLALTDSLTGLANRSLLLERVQQGIERSARTGQAIALAVFDIDHFRAVNQEFGSAIADELLRSVAERIEPLVRRDDTLARLGSDEFALLTLQPNRLGAVMAIAERLLESVRRPWTLDGEQVEVTASVGVAVYTSETEDALSLLDAATIAMRRAKHSGRDSAQFFDGSMNVAAADRWRRERELRAALNDEQLVLYYQPLVGLNDGCIYGAEALARWPHPDRGLLEPAEFIPLAEDTGLIGRLDSWGLSAACRDAASWHHDGFSNIRVSVNISPSHLHSSAFIPTTETVLRETGLPPADLEIELTETALLPETSLARRVLGTISDRGMSVALDDFGTGYSSLSYLYELPIQTVKIDRTFVAAIGVDEHAASIVRAVVDLAHTLGLSVVAEGIETADQLHRVQALGADLGQGYYFAAPLPDEVFRDLLAGPDDVFSSLLAHDCLGDNLERTSM